MPPVHVALALLVTLIWGLAFVATRLALDDVSPPLLTALRFLVAALPAAALPRPPIPWRTLMTIGLALYTGQFLFQFFGIAAGMPPGLAAIVVQSQALKRLPPVDPLALAVWLSLVPPVPALALAFLLDGPGALRAGRGASRVAIGAVLYLGLVATVLAYAIWGYLLRRHPAARVAPFALLVPFVAAAASALVLGERFGARRLLGMALVLAGLAIIAGPSAGVTEPAARSR